MLCKRQIVLLFFVLLTVALVTPVAQAQARPTNLTDSQEPGSVLVFPLFEGGTGTISDQGTVPHSAFEISVVCPTPIAPCQNHQDVDIHLTWVCAGRSFGNIPCSESDFTLTTTVNGTIRFNPASTTCTPAPNFQDGEGCGSVQLPPCSKGYLVAWVVNSADQPIKFDGLIGDAVIRESGGAVAAYNAIPIQANPALTTNVPIAEANTAADPDAASSLEFDDPAPPTPAVGEYQQVTGKIFGSLRYDNTSVNSAGAVIGRQKTSLILLTLDVLSNRLNPDTNVDLTFYNEREINTSHSTFFNCFEEQPLSAFSLNSSFCNDDRGCKGLVVSKPATQGGTPVSLLGLVITREYNAPAGILLRHYAYPLFNDSTAVDTDFVP